MAESFEVSTFFPTISAERIYRSWLDSDEHSAFTGSPAQIDPGVGGKFTAWEGYIYGKTLEAEPSGVFCKPGVRLNFQSTAPIHSLRFWSKKLMTVRKSRLFTQTYRKARVKITAGDGKNTILNPCSTIFPLSSDN